MWWSVQHCLWFSGVSCHCWSLEKVELEVWKSLEKVWNFLFSCCCGPWEKQWRWSAFGHVPETNHQLLLLTSLHRIDPSWIHTVVHWEHVYHLGTCLLDCKQLFPTLLRVWTLVWCHDSLMAVRCLSFLVLVLVSHVPAGTHLVDLLFVMIYWIR